MKAERIFVTCLVLVLAASMALSFLPRAKADYADTTNIPYTVFNSDDLVKYVLNGTGNQYEIDLSQLVWDGITTSGFTTVNLFFNWTDFSLGEGTGEYIWIQYVNYTDGSASYFEVQVSIDGSLIADSSSNGYELQLWNPSNITMYFSGTALIVDDPTLDAIVGTTPFLTVDPSGGLNHDTVPVNVCGNNDAVEFFQSGNVVIYNGYFNTGPTPEPTPTPVPTSFVDSVGSSGMSTIAIMAIIPIISVASGIVGVVMMLKTGHGDGKAIIAIIVTVMLVIILLEVAVAIIASFQSATNGLLNQ